MQEIENGLPSVNYIRTLNIDEPLVRIDLATNTVRYYHTDALGSMIGLSNESGQEVTQYAYDPFGQVSISGELSDNAFQYTGRENDGTGLYYYRARYYSPELQRFISEDPISKPGDPNVAFLLPALLKAPAMLHAYDYVGNRPLNYTDPEGLWWWIPGLLLPPLLVGGVMVYCEITCRDQCNKLYPVVMNEVGYDSNYQSRMRCIAKCSYPALLGALFGSDPLTGPVQAPFHPH